ncbi:Short-chain dehydrogenase RED3 [Psilocybe cubensis]|uniref:Short-chain dehydrogenase RED3 n=1 Tax=Psilocybe cubensis TaxID=181762 RepID=A0ACB8GRM3_PSICU|nr:Short-chain dehydrogenase RED3 [Psilocybe cubensis]KAH9478239.1 Short-chain dehydrogenase RED3 [Psilocybe cubensis]
MSPPMQVNVMGPIVLFQAMLPLLKKSPNPKFVPMSSTGGSIGGENLVASQVGGVCYGATKATLNWVARKIHFENDWIVAFPMSPGGVSTDLLSDTSDNDPTGIFKTFLTGNEPTAEEAAKLIMQVIDDSTRETSGGKFMHLDGSTIPW